MILHCRRICVMIALAFCNPARADGPDGNVVYQQKCSRCHGKTGEGTKEHPNPLIGNRSLAQLSKYIAKRMPEDKPGTCVGVEAENVAKFMYDAFYSPAAQAKIKTPRVELARLTVNEYRNAVADLVGAFPAGKIVATEQQGLRGDYFTSGPKRNRTPAFNRIDPVVHLDLGPDSPDYERLKTPEIAANWQGSVIAIDTGVHDFIVRTEHSTRFWINDMKTPLIDKAVKSGSETEFRASIHLLGGRAYPVRLEFSRASVGVRKDPKEKLVQAKTTMSLDWKPPRRAEEPIPARNLMPVGVGTSFAPATAMPPDDRSAGYERGTAVSKAWVQATTDGAIETAAYVADHLAELTGVRPDASDRKTKLREFCAQFAERGFRRPLTPEQKKLYVDHQFELAKDDETAVKRVVLLVLQSPRFLYREPNVAGDAFDVASRISFGLWDTLPDAELLKAAATGRLKTRDDVVREAERMIADRRAKTKMRGFLMQWLKLDQVAEMQKDAKRFPDFNADVVSDLRTSLELFLDEVIWSPRSDFRHLFTAEHLHLNGRLAMVYDADLPEDADYYKVKLKDGGRAGVLTHPYLLANYSHTATSSPIHRGVFLARNLLGVSLRPPTDAFTPLAPELHPNLSTRERIALQTSPKNCQSCHTVINPLGFTLERFDAIGRFRDKEAGKPIDASGSFMTRSGETVTFKGERDLARFLAGSDEAHEAFVARLFHHLVRQPVLAFGPEKLDELRRYFADLEFNVRRLAVEIIAQTALPAK